jgi:branched-chain amino acid aminotransferase
VTRELPALFVNGVRQVEDSPHISARDRGLTLGDGLFETMRARGGAIFKLDRHLARLRHGLALFAIAEPPRLREWVLTAMRAATDGDASVRLTVTRGPGAAGVAPPADARATVIVSVNPMPVFPAAVYEQGLHALVASGRRNERAMTSGVKTLAYGDAIAAWIEAHRAGKDEALFLDTEGHCSEATASNLFIATGGVLLTPPVSCAALPGITRATILDLARERSIEALERPFGETELMAADEAFLTSSLRGIAPLVGVGTATIGGGTPGPLTRGLADAYAALVDEQCANAASKAAPCTIEASPR